ncbi:MAG: RNA-binding protein [Thermoanaerobaculaceae bacterium]|jgi:RNA recognition motif-containing protein|nr:RNA-binding protein [Thermoanaerobaculaceae bacterium]
MKLYIGNLPFDARDEQLQELFGTFGTPSTTKVIVDPQRGRSRGFGFVEFDDPAQGRAAIAGLHGTEFGGRTLVVNEARPQGGGMNDRRGPRGSFGGGRGDGDRSERRPSGGRRF